jgi:hypothetical protein
MEFITVEISSLIMLKIGSLKTVVRLRKRT